MKNENKIQLCEECGCFVFIGAKMQCANGHDIDVSKLTRDDVVPFYQMLIENATEPDGEIVVAFNKKILGKWSSSVLTYIKDKAWKQVASNERQNNIVFDI